jgi:UDPglucose 6-dehydrogenase
MAELGHEVIGVDTDSAKIACLSSGRAPFHANGLDELLAKHTANGRLRFSTRFDDAADFADVHFVTVGTSQLPGSDSYDLSYLYQAVGQLASRLHRPSLIIGKSTVPVGTAQQLAECIRNIAGAGASVQLVESRVPAGVFGDLRHAATRPHRGGA